MIVYRIEKNGWGAFCRDRNDLWPEYSEDSVYKDTWCFMGAPNNSKLRFACDTLDKLVAYFGSDFAHCLAKGGEIVAYKVRKNYVTFDAYGLELAFQAEKAERISL